MNANRVEAQRRRHQEARAAAEARMLRKLREVGSPLPFSEVAKVFRCTRMYAWVLLQRLVGQGLVEKTSVVLQGRAVAAYAVRPAATPATEPGTGV